MAALALPAPKAGEFLAPELLEGWEPAQLEEDQLQLNIRWGSCRSLEIRHGEPRVIPCRLVWHENETDAQQRSQITSEPGCFLEQFCLLDPFTILNTYCIYVNR